MKRKIKNHTSKSFVSSSMDESPNKPDGFILTKSKTPDSDTDHYQITNPHVKTGVWKIINFFVRHKNHKRVTSQKAKLALSPTFFNSIDNNYGLCLLSEELGDQSIPFDKELLMEDEKVEGETPSGGGSKTGTDAKKFFHKMNLEGLMKLFADLHRKKRARELSKPKPSLSEQISNSIASEQPSTFEKLDKYKRISSSMPLKREITISGASSATIIETNYTRTNNMATPANSPQLTTIKDQTHENDCDGTLNLLECVRTKLTDYLNAEESVNSLRATYNDSTQCEELIDDDWSKRMTTTLDNDSLKCDTSCDDISSLRNNSLHILDDMTDISKDSIYSRQSFKENVFNSSFLEDAINSEIIPPFVSTKKRVVECQLLHAVPFTDSIYQDLFPTMLSTHQLNIPLSLQEYSLGSEDVETKSIDKGADAISISLCTTGVGSNQALVEVESQSSGTMRIFNEDLITLEDDNSSTFKAKEERYVDVVAVPRGSQDIIDDEEPYLVSDTIEDTSIDEDFQNLRDEDLVYAMENEDEDKDENSNEINDENEDEMEEGSKDEMEDRSKDEMKIRNKNENKDEVKDENIEEIKDENIEEAKTTELLFVCKYMDYENEFKNEKEVKDFEETLTAGNSEVSFDEASQTNDVIVLEKDQLSSLTEKIELETMIRNEITNSINVALENNVTMITEDQKASQEELDFSNKVLSNESNQVNDIKHNPSEENVENVYLSNSITSDLLSNLDLSLITRKDDVSNAGSDSGIYMSKNASRITTLTYKASQTIHQPIADKPIKIEGETLTSKINKSKTKIIEKKLDEYECDLETQLNQEAILESLQENHKRRLSSNTPEQAYAQVEADIKTMIKELLYETEDIKETIIALTPYSRRSSSIKICKEIVEGMVNNVIKENIPMEAEINTNEKESNQDRNEIDDIMENLIEKVCGTVDSKSQKNVLSVNYSLVRNNFHDKIKKHDSRVVRANKLFRTFCKIKGNSYGYTQPKVTVVNLSPTSQRFLRSEEKLTNRIRRSAALLMALYEEMRDYSYYSCTSNILCDLYESMSRNERYLNLQKIPKTLEGTSKNFISNVNVFLNYETITDVDVKIQAKAKEEKGEYSKFKNCNKGNCSTKEGSSSIPSSSFADKLFISTSNSSIDSESDEEIPSLGILPNLKYTYFSQEEINTDEEIMMIDNNIEKNSGRDLGFNIPLKESLSIDSIHTDIDINDSENFIIFQDLSMA